MTANVLVGHFVRKLSASFLILYRSDPITEIRIRAGFGGFNLYYIVGDISAILYWLQEDQTVNHMIVCRQNPVQGEKKLIYFDDYGIKVKMAIWAL